MMLQLCYPLPVSMKLKICKIIFGFLFLYTSSAIAINIDGGFDKGKLPADQITPDCTNWSKNLSCAQQNQQAVDDIVDQLSSSAGVNWYDLSGYTTGYVLTATGSGVGASWQSAAAGSQTPWSSNINAAGYSLYNVGNIGVGSVNPTQTLDVIGTVKATTFSGAGTGLTGTATSLNIGGNSATTTALASAPTTCSAGQGSTGINTSGNAQGCTTYLQGNQNITLTGTGNVIGSASGTTSISIPLTVNWQSINALISSYNVNWNDVNRNSNLNSGGINWNDVNKVKPINFGGVNWSDWGNYASGFMKWNGASAPTQDSNSYLTTSSAASTYVPQTTTVNGHALSGNVSVTASDVGLGAVENTALSTWPGTANITTVGNLTANVGIGSATPGTQLDVNGTLRGIAVKIRGGTSSQFLKADGSTDSTAYQPTGAYLTAVTADSPLSGSGTAASHLVFTNPGYISNVGIGTANTIAYWDSTSTIGSLNTTTYPSLTELSYSKGVTSAIQTQLNGKQASGTYITTLLPITLSSPNVGIGSLTPGQVLDVQGTLRGTAFIKTSGTSGQFLKADGTIDSSSYITGNQSITLSSDVTGTGTTAITATLASAYKGWSLSGSNINTAGTYNVGIGSATPGQALDINGTVRATALIKSGGTSGQFLKADGSVDSTTYQASGNYLTAVTADSPLSGSGTAASHLVFTNPGYLSTISPITLASPNVGIGSATPGQTLDVIGTIRASQNIGIGTYNVCTTSGNCPSSGSGANPGGSATQLQYQVNGTTFGGVSGSGVDSNGNVGIGSAVPGTKLDVIGTIRASGSAQFTGAGNVGIGTLAPGGNLDVGAGTICLGHVCNSSWPSGVISLAGSSSPSSASSVTISGLNSSTNYLMFVSYVQNTSYGTPTIQFNGDSGSNYEYQSMVANGGVGQASSTSATSISITSNTIAPGSNTSYFMYFSTSGLSGNFVDALILSGGDRSGSVGYATAWGGYNGASGLTSVTFATSAGTITGSVKVYAIN